MLYLHGFSDLDGFRFSGGLDLMKEVGVSVIFVLFV